jgi:hypothetical protein
MDLARAPRRAARKKGSVYENGMYSYSSLVPVALKQAQEKTWIHPRTRLGSRCDVTAQGASERLADFSIFNMV